MITQGTPNFGSVVQKMKGQSIPDDVIQNALLTATVFGIAASDGEGKVDLTRMSTKEMAEGQEAEVKALLDYYKDKDCLVFFGNYEEGFSEESIQPIPLVVNEKNEPLMVTALFGDFSEDERPPHQSDALKHVSEYLGPKFAKMFHGEEVKGNFEKFVAAIRSDKVFLRELEKAGRGETLTCILLGNGDLFQFPGESKQVSDHDWGAITISPEPEPAKEEPTPEPEKAPEEDLSKLPPALRRKREKEIAAQKAAAAPEPEKTEVKSSVPSVSPDTGTKDDDYEMVSPPAGLSNQEKRKWYTSRTPDGTLPKGWHKDCAIPVKKGPQKRLTDLKSELEKKGKLPPPLGPAQRQQKDVAAQHVPEATPRDQNLPLISAEGKRKVKESFMKGRSVALIDVTKKEIMDPVLLKYAENKAADFSASYDIPLSATLPWSKDELFTLGESDLQSLVQLCFDRGAELIRKYQQDFMAAQKEGDATKTAEELAKMPPALRRKYEKANAA